MALKEEILAHHKFAFQELAPGSGSNEQPYVRLMMFIKKRPDISDEKFHEWWKTVHADLAVAVQDFGGHCLRYDQLHQSAEHRAQLKKYGFEILDYDGIGEMHIKSLDDWIAFSSTPAFAKHLGGRPYLGISELIAVFANTAIADGANFMDGKLKVMLGSNNLIFGSKIATSGGADGILPSDPRLTFSKGKSKL